MPNRLNPFVALTGAGVLVGTMLSATAVTGAATATAAPREAPVYRVVQEGMTEQQAARLADRLGIPAALEENGRFSFVDERRFAALPEIAGAAGRDEDGHDTLALKLNRKALAGLEVLDEQEALGLAREVLDQPAGFDIAPRVDHTTVELANKAGKVLETHNLDTTVAYDLSLGGFPVVGPGSRIRASFAADGSVIQLTESLRQVEQAGSIGIISEEEALAECTRLYGAKVVQTVPQLVYFSPALTGQGRGSVEMLLPHYVCEPTTKTPDESSAIVGKLIPAAPELAPHVSVKAGRTGNAVTAGLEIAGGTAPYAVSWSSSSTLLDSAEAEISYSLRGRDKKARAEGLTATVVDANGLTAQVKVNLPAAGGEASAEGFGGAGGAFGSVGIEQTVDEWQCAQDSANGFRNVMQAKGQSVAFDWRGTNAWEKDFKKVSLGGIDNQYVDNVDAQWYTGHGSPGRFTFKNTTQSDGSIVPGDAVWGNDWNLEWMQLESCQVLADTTGTGSYFSTWAPVFDRLHVLNGFHTNAYCINGGTGARFADYLFPTWWRGGLTVSQAWAAMANDLEPSGVRWRSMSAATTGWVHNLGDHYWGQGSTGPDIAANQRIGFIAISGVV